MVEEKERYRKSERAVLGCWGGVGLGVGLGGGRGRESPAEGGTILLSQLLPTWRKPLLCTVHSTETLEDSDTF
jgi:hypothetical protein